MFSDNVAWDSRGGYTALRRRPRSFESPPTLSSATTTMAQKNTPLAVASRFPNMPGKTADLDQTWAYLTSGVDHIMTNIEAGLSFADYTNLYTTVYNYCTSTKMHSRLEIGNRSTCLVFFSPLTNFFLSCG